MSESMITDEIFDFDLHSDTSSSASPQIQEDEDEVFFGPVKHRERIAASHVRSTKKEHDNSSLNDRQWAELHKEANRMIKRMAKDVDSGETKPSRVVVQKLFDYESPRTRSITKKTGKQLVSLGGQENEDPILHGEKLISLLGNQENVDAILRGEQLISLGNLDNTDAILRGEQLISLGNQENVEPGLRGEQLISLGNQENLDAIHHGKKIISVGNQDIVDSVNVSNFKPDCDGVRHDSKLPLCEVTTNLGDCALEARKKSKMPEKNKATYKPSSENTENQTIRRSIGRLQCNKQSNLTLPTKTQLLKKSPVEAPLSKVQKSRLPCMKTRGIPSLNGSGSKLQKPSGLVRPSVNTSAVKVEEMKLVENIEETKETGKGDETKSAGKVEEVKVAEKGDGTQTVEKVDESKSATKVIPGKIAPTSRLQLLKPSGIKRPSGLMKPGDSLKKNGPMKAFAPLSSQTEKVLAHITPAKVEKSVKRKNLSASFTSPAKSGSTSSMESPMMRRRSALPTPNKSQTSSLGSIPSPGPHRSGSSSSTRSIESPLVFGSASKRRPSTVTKGSGRHGSISEFSDRSPSSMMSKRSLVVNTPNLPKKRISPWSPVEKKRACDQLEEATRCTKKRMI